MERGDIVLAPFPYSDLRGLKRRPACVVSSAVFNDGPDAIVAMVTSRRTRLDSPGVGDVLLDHWRQAGLRLPSVIRTGRLLVIERRLLAAGLGRLDAVDLLAVDRALRTVLGLR
ncbi:MAG: type II toxin-antitoxin system PemK/MazF family toxin [Acidimicrobiales bacterium]